LGRRIRTKLGMVFALLRWNISPKGLYMSGFRTFLKSGHAPTLFAAFFYFDFCFIGTLVKLMIIFTAA